MPDQGSKLGPLHWGLRVLTTAYTVLGGPLWGIVEVVKTASRVTVSALEPHSPLLVVLFFLSFF